MNHRANIKSDKAGIAEWLLIAGILLGSVVLGLYGMHRSLWLDEAWVANSVRQPSLDAMFRYPDWLQTSPPLFLVFARAWVSQFGLSIETFRSIPMVFAFAAAAAMLAACRRVVGWPLAILATSVLLFSPTAIEQFRSFKQYAGEIAASAGVLYAAIRYLQSRSAQDFAWLCATAGFLLALAYPLIFFMPGIVAVVWLSGHRKGALGLSAMVGVIEGILYLFFIRPNLAPHLWTFWSVGWRDIFSTSVVAGVALGAAAAVQLRGEDSEAQRVRLICLVPCGLFLLAEIAGFYPTDPRMRLFLWPPVLLVAATLLQPLLASLPGNGSRTIALVAAFFMMTSGLVRTFADHRDIAFENYADAIKTLRSQLKPQDLLLVHADAREGFLLHAAIGHWTGWEAQTRFGSTGWPCCGRNRDDGPGSGSADAVRLDLERMVPKGFQGKVWLLYANRTLHWKYLGLDEGDLWRRTMWDRGCLPIEYLDLGNLVLSPMACTASSK